MWPVHHLNDSAEALHHAVLPAERGVWVMTPTRSAIVLGSSQKDGDVDMEFCRDAGIDVVRRRSGGGAVYVHPTQSLWIDVVIARGDPLWCDDIGESMWWLGEQFGESLAEAGLGELLVHRTAPVRNEWSNALCFAGIGSGEVVDIGTSGVPRKVVGISQRRTRDFARFQCIIYGEWNAPLHCKILPILQSDPGRVEVLVATVDPEHLGFEYLSPQLLGF